MAEFWVTEYSGFMRDILSFRYISLRYHLDILSFTMKNIHPFNFSSIETDLFRILNLRIVSKIFKDSKGIPPNVFANILTSMSPKNFDPHYQSGFPLNPGKIGI